MDLLDELEQMAQTALLHGEEYDPNAIPQYLLEQQTSTRSYKQTEIYYVRLEGPLTDPNSVQQLGSITRMPERVQDEGDTGAEFCIVDGMARFNIEQKLLGVFKPTFILINKALKDLSEHSWAPFLGLDCSLPQNRPSVAAVDPEPSTSQYPVWYFFYGTLANVSQLHRVVKRREERYNLIPAEVTGGEIKIWGRKYKALVDSLELGAIEGMAFQVETQQEEDSLMVYETNAYEVVRCIISMQHEKVYGLTFRFCGSLIELT